MADPMKKRLGIAPTHDHTHQLTIFPTVYILPIAFPTKGITAVLSDTWGRLSNSSAMAGQTEGASINAVTPNSVQIINYWSGGLKTNVTVLALGY